jgi:ribose-phosphate pyrophosphokinase
VSAVNLIKDHGAKSITVVFIHPVIAPGTAEKLAALPVERFITTDTIPISQDNMAYFDGRLQVVTIANLLSEVIRRANAGVSVGQLFNE